MTTTIMKTEAGVRAEPDQWDRWGTRYRRTHSCDKHGPYEDSGYRLNSAAVAGKPIRWAGCPRCAEERKAESEHREREEARLKRLADRIERSGIPYRLSDATLDSYIATDPGQRHALEVANEYAADFRATWERGHGLLLLGNVGTGKTHLAVGIAHKAMEQGAEVIFTTAADMIGKVKATWGQRGGDSEMQVIQRFASAALLVLDELGSIKCSGREREILFAILNGRHNKELPTVFTANLKPDELPGYLGDQIVSRLRESGSQSVIFGWGDYRPIKGKQAMANRSAAND